MKMNDASWEYFMWTHKDTDPVTKVTTIKIEMLGYGDINKIKLW